MHQIGQQQPDRQGIGARLLPAGLLKGLGEQRFGLRSPALLQLQQGHQLQRLALLSQIRDGEYFVRCHYGAQKDLLNPLQLGFIDPNDIQGTAGLTSTVGFNHYLDSGIERDQYGREVAYHFYQWTGKDYAPKRIAARTPEGLPLAYEMLPGNTADKTTLRAMLALVQKRHGRARRVWVMDRGIPTEEVLAEMRAATPAVHYLVGTPKGRLTKLESRLTERPWVEVRGQLRVKSIDENAETYVYTESPARVHNERSMRRRALKKYWKRLGELAGLKTPKRDEVLIKLGQAREQAGRAVAKLVEVEVDADGRLARRLDLGALRAARRREGRYLLRTNLSDAAPDTLWRYYMQLTAVEESFRTLKGDLGLRPIYHQNPERIEAHLFVAFLAYCLSTTLRQQLRAVAGGLMPRVVLEKLSTVMMLDVSLPTTDGRELVLARRTEPEADVQLLLNQLNLTLPDQPPPRICAAAV
jgi:hypothetical protein